jgi:hypothetical protein
MGDLRRPAALLLVRTLWVSSPTPGAATAQVLAAMRVSLARSFVADPSRIRHVERVGERVHVGVEQVPVNGQRERGRTVRAITGLLGLRRCAGASSITTIDRCSSSACFRAIGFARCWGSPTRSSVGGRVRHRWRCSGAFPDRVGYPPLVEPPKTGRTRDQFATLPFPVP